MYGARRRAVCAPSASIKRAKFARPARRNRSSRVAQADRLTIGEVAALAGVQASTLRYYERIGILPRPPRVSGQRRYSREILALLAVIQLAKEADFSLPEIQALLYGAEGTPSER